MKIYLITHIIFVIVIEYKNIIEPNPGEPGDAKTSYVALSIGRIRMECRDIEVA